MDWTDSSSRKSTRHHSIQTEDAHCILSRKEEMKMNATISRTVIEEAVILFYEAAGFRADVLEAEVRSMSDQKLMEVYLAL